MSAATKKCKVCGKEYKYCRTLLPGIFRWQDVACCYEHARIYFDQIEASRNPVIQQNDINNSAEESVDGNDPVVEEKSTRKKTRKSKANTTTAEE